MPVAGTVLGVIEPVRTWPVVWLSSLNVTVWPGTKFVMDPVSTCGSDVTLVGERVKAGALTVAAVDWALSFPRQSCLAGVIE